MSDEAVAGGPPAAEPHPGTAGWLDRLHGPGASRAEWAVTVGAAVASAIAVPLAATSAGLGWSPLQVVVVTVMAVDIAGGVSANAAPSATRWFHRPGREARHHLAFVAAHGHLLLLAALFPGLGWGAAVLGYVGVVAAAVVVVLTPRPVRRPVAFVVASGVLLLGLYVVAVPPGLEWVLPALTLKLLLGHLLPDEHAGPPE